MITRTTSMRLRAETSRRLKIAAAVRGLSADALINSALDALELQNVGAPTSAPRNPQQN